MKIVQFFKLAAKVCGGWWSLMSGAISIPFAFAALFGKEKLLFGLLAFFALLITACRTAWLNFQLLDSHKAKLEAQKELSESKATLNKEIARLETDCTEAKRQIAILQIQIEDDGVKLDVTSTLEAVNNKNRVEGLLKVQAVNNGRRPAKIRRVILLGLPTTLTIVGNPSAPPLESIGCEHILHQKEVVVEIEGDGGLHIWQAQILKNPNYKYVEKNGARYAQGFLEFTNGHRKDFETLLLPDDLMQKMGCWLNPPYN